MSEEESRQDHPESEGTNDKDQSKAADKERTDDDDETLTQVSELNDGKSNRKPKVKSKQDENEEKRKKFFQEELKRLQKSLQVESSKIQAPPVQEYVPYCFNALGPYYDTTTAEHVIIKTGDNGKLKDAVSEYATRYTAIGLVDPWVSNKMDTTPAPSVKVKKPQPFRESPKKEKKIGEGSTMIPVFPHVDMDTPDLASRKLDYGDVPMLRKELREKYSSQGKAKIDSDYQRTKVDFYRMELHKLNDVHPMNRGNMKAAYFAYLQNTPGSKKAVKECVEEILSEKQDDEDKSAENTEKEKTTAKDEQEQHQSKDEPIETGSEGQTAEAGEDDAN